MNRVMNIMDVTKKKKKGREQTTIMVKPTLITGHQSQFNSLQTSSADFSRTWNGSKISD